MNIFKSVLLVGAMTMMAELAFAQTWTQTSASSNNWWSVDSSADGCKLIVGTAAGGDQCIYTSTNSGFTWVSNNVPKSYWCSVSSSADGTKLAAAAIDGPSGLYVSTNSGATWLRTCNVTSYWYSIASSADGRKIVAVGETSYWPYYYSNRISQLFSSTNYGSTWTSNSSPPAEFCGVASSADGTKLVAPVTNGGGIFTSVNSGTTWVSNRIYDGAWASVASSADGAKLTAVSHYGSIYTSTNSGGVWKLNGASLPMFSVAASVDGSKLLGSSDDHLYISTNSGATWKAADVTGKYWRGVAMSADGSKLVAVSALGGIWTAQVTPAPRIHLAPTNGNLTLAWTVPSTNFTLQQSADLSSWASVTNPPVLNLTNLQNEVTLPPSGNNSFYRLRTP
jgi:hypothetical protein